MGRFGYETQVEDNVICDLMHMWPYQGLSDTTEQASAAAP